MLRPGGELGVVDFYVGGDAEESMTREHHGALARWFWTFWLRRDHVHLSPRHLDALCAVTQRNHLHEGTVALAHLPVLKAPYYVYVGVKTARPLAELMKDLWKQSAGHA